jgi:NAD(P)H-hydrate epimerase
VKILTPESMRAVDQTAIEDVGIPSLVLMENAAIGVVDALAEVFPQARSVTVLCGPGNNGGDGLAAARHLAIRGYIVRTFLLFDGEPGGDAEVQLTICRNQGLEIRQVSEEGGDRRLIEAARDSDLVIDALFGTGLSRPLEGRVAELVAAVNRLPVPRLAVDLPSGLNGGSAEIPGPHLEAELTVTFAAPKLAHILPPAAESVGEVVVADLGIPPELVEGAAGDLFLLQAGELAPLLMPRPADGHKGDFGHVLLFAGGIGKAGAAILAARGAVRGGAGLVTVAVPAPILNAVDGGSLESMTMPLEVNAGGLAPAAADQLLEAATGKDALALGPGLGLEPSTVEVVRRVCREAKLPLVIDADGLNAFAGELQAVADRTAPTLLTPHPGELARLLGVGTSEVLADRLGLARRAAAAARSLVVLKGNQSLVAGDDGRIWINSTGNPGMATGGSGDVLTGVLAALIAQGYEVPVAAQIGVYLHGLAGDLAVETTGMTALAADDLVGHLGAAFESLSRA